MMSCIVKINILKHEHVKAFQFLRVIGDMFPAIYREMLDMARLSENGFSVEIKPIRYRHSREQENYYWKYEREFAKHCGYTPDELHEILLRICYGSDFIDGPLGHVNRPRKRSSDAKVNEYVDLIDTLTRVAAEQGFVVPPPIHMLDKQEITNEPTKKSGIYQQSD